MPMPQLKVRASSAGSIAPPAWRKANRRGRGQLSASTTACAPSGSTRGIFSSRPPPVMWASAPILPFADQRQQALHIDARRLEQDVAEQPVLVEQGRAVELPAVDLDQPADQREAVRMDARAGEAEDDVARRDLLAGQRLGPVDRADAEAGEVIVAGGIHARHFRRLAADQRAAGLAAALGDRGDDRGRRRRCRASRWR